MLFKILYDSHQHKILPINHKTTQRVKRVIKLSLESNENFDEIKNTKWSVFVIKDSNIANAFVLPTGQIFVYTEIIKMSDNDSQLGAILAHELSHVLLGHGKEIVKILLKLC